MEQLWVICDDSFDFKITDLTPIDGYLFFYENVCLKLSNDLLNRLSTFFQEQRNSHFQYLTSQSENFEIPRSFAKRNINSKQLAKTTSQIDRDPNDQSIVLELSRCETIEMLKSLNISFNNDRSTARLKEILVNKIKSNHAIHQFLRDIDVSKLKMIASKININYRDNYSRVRTRIANHFFKASPESSLTNLRQCINSIDVDETTIDKKHPIFEFLKTISDDEIKMYTKKLGKNNLRNFNSMRSFIGDFFFEHDKKTPLESLKMFIKGELPELDVTLKKEPIKRKSESRSGLQTKKSKTDLEAINENQEKLKNCRRNFLDSI